MTGKRGRKIFAILFFIALIAGIYFMYFFSYSCNDLACFKSHQEKCSKATLVKDVQDATWRYSIGKGHNYILSRYIGNKCSVDVKIINIKEGNLDAQRLEGLTMTCEIVKGSTESPESDLNQCHGLLKEEMQSMIINKLHNYIVGSIGQVAEQLERAV